MKSARGRLETNQAFKDIHVDVQEREKRDV
jgi:hypothetical protein